MSAWALVVAINEYPSAPDLKTLQGAVADAADFADWLLDPNGGQVAQNHLFFWTYPAPVNPKPHLAAYMANPTPWPREGPDFNQPPEARHVRYCVPELANQAIAANATRIYVFFAGHGTEMEPQTYDQDPQTCFIAGDYYPNALAEGLVGFESVRRYFQRTAIPELILFFDCCRSKAPLKVGAVATGWNQKAWRQPPRTGIGRASQPGAVAYETSHNGIFRGAFSKLLVGALREHRVNGVLTLQDLEKYVNEGIAELVKPDYQIPDFSEMPKPPAIVLTASPVANVLIPFDITFTKIPVGAIFEVLDEDTNLVFQAQVAPGINRVQLRAGSYSVEHVNAAGIRELLALHNHLGPGVTNVTA